MQSHKLNTPSTIESSAEDRVRSRIRHDFLPADSNLDQNRVRDVEDRVLNVIKLYSDQRSASADISRAEQELRRSLDKSCARGDARVQHEPEDLDQV